MFYNQPTGNKTPIESMYDTVYTIMNNFQLGSDRPILRGSINLDDSDIYKFITNSVIKATPAILGKSVIYTCKWTDKKKFNVVFIPRDVYYKDENLVTVADLSAFSPSYDQYLVLNDIVVVPLDADDEDPRHIAAALNIIFENFICFIIGNFDACGASYYTMRYMLKKYTLDNEQKRDLFNYLFMNLYDYEIRNMHIPDEKTEHYINKIGNAPFVNCIAYFQKFFHDDGFELSSSMADNFSPKVLIPTIFKLPEWGEDIKKEYQTNETIDLISSEDSEKEDQDETSGDISQT